MAKTLLFNATTNNAGGGLKNSALFIKHALSDSRFCWKFAVSEEVYQLVLKLGVSEFDCHLFRTSPARSFSARDRLKTLSIVLKADLVYTMAGPSYVRFDCLHVQGISDPYATHAQVADFLYGRSVIGAVAKFLSSWYKKKYWCLADALIFQTEFSKQQFILKNRIDQQPCFVVPNAIDEDLLGDEKKTSQGDWARRTEHIVLCPGEDYPHKALGTIPYVAQASRRSNEAQDAFKFRLTLDPGSASWRRITATAKRLGVDDLITTTGRYSYANVRDIFDNVGIVYVPSILEVFSASYIEAFAVGRPLLCADRNFARDVCGNAAAYVDPLQPSEVVRAMQQLVNDTQKVSEICHEGIQRLKFFGGQEIRYERITACLESLVQTG